MGRPAKGVRVYQRPASGQWIIIDGTFQRRLKADSREEAERELETYLRVKSGQSPVAWRHWKDEPSMIRHLAYRAVRRAKHRSALRGEPFELTVDMVMEMIEAQDMRCAVSGMPLSRAPSRKGSRMPFAPSIDRLDNSRGYQPDNIRVVGGRRNAVLGRRRNSLQLSQPHPDTQ